MQKRMNFLLLAACCGCFIACATEPASTEGKKSLDAVPSSREQVTLSAELPERLVSGGEWPMTVVLHNASEEPVRVSLRRSDRSDIQVKVWDANGKRVERTEFGERHLPGELIDDVTSAILKSIEPGESHRWEIAFGKCFVFEPGTYRVEISVSVLPIGQVKHEFEIEVLPVVP